MMWWQAVMGDFFLLMNSTLFTHPILFLISFFFYVVAVYRLFVFIDYLKHYRLARGGKKGEK